MPQKPPPPELIPLDPDHPTNKSGVMIAIILVLLGLGTVFLSYSKNSLVAGAKEIESTQIVTEIKTPDGVRCFQIVWTNGARIQAEGLSCFPVNK